MTIDHKKVKKISEYFQKNGYPKQVLNPYPWMKVVDPQLFVSSCLASINSGKDDFHAKQAYEYLVKYYETIKQTKPLQN